MIEDSILREVRAAREAYARLHDFDVRRIVADLQKLDSARDWHVVSFAAEPATRTPADAIAIVSFGDDAKVETP